MWDKIEITLSFVNPIGGLQKNVGIFNKAASKAFRNYTDNGISALHNDKAFERENFTPGNVQFIQLSDTSQACQIVCDYLIICAGKFIIPRPPRPHDQVIRLAEHRAYYNGLDVAIVSVDNILALNFYFEEQDQHSGPDYQYKNEQM